MRTLLMFVAFAVAPTITAQAPRTIPVSVLTQFGGAQDDPAAELLRVSGAVRTDDGRFVVVNGRPLEVRVYDQRGRLQRRLGRSGNGPGEFQYSAVLRHWPGDSVLTYSTSTRRWMLFGLDGTLVREWPLGEAEPAPNSVILLGGAFALATMGEAVHCRAAVIRRLAPVAGPLHQALVDPAGRLWLSAADADLWRVFDPAGRLIGTVNLPRFTATQFHRDALVGHQLDDDDFPHIVALRPALPVATVPQRECPPATVQSDRSGEIRATIRNAMTAAEAYYADHGRYPRDLKELGRMLELPTGIGGRFEAATPNSFAFSAWEVTTGFRCLVTVGGPIRSYLDGVIGCGG